MSDDSHTKSKNVKIYPLNWKNIGRRNLITGPKLARPLQNLSQKSHRWNVISQRSFYRLSL